MIRNRYTAAVNDKPWWLAGGIPASACVAAYQCKGANSYDAGLINLANPGIFNINVTTPVTSWSIDAGMTGGAWVTGITQVTNKLENKTAFSTVFSFGYISANYYLGENANYVYRHYNATTFRYYIDSSSFNVTVPSGADAVVAMAGMNCYYNGIYKGAVVDESGVRTYSLQAYPTGSDAFYFRGLAVYNTMLTDTQVCNVSERMSMF